MAVTWVSCDATTGKVIAEFPNLEVDAISQTIGEYATATASLPIDATVSDEWLEATAPMSTVLVLVEDGVPTWGGIVTKRERTTSTSVALGLLSVEGYFERRYVPTQSFSNEDQCEIVKGLVETNCGDSLAMSYSVTPSATERTRNYDGESDKTVYSALHELSEVVYGPEWTVEWTALMVDSQQAYRPVLVVADRVGSEPVGPEPDAWVELAADGGNVVEARLFESYAMDDGANHVQAVSSAGAGDGTPEADGTRAESDWYIDAANKRRLRADYRWEPSNSITSVGTLNLHAEAMLSRMQDGALSIECTLSGSNPLNLGTALHLGDTVGVRLAGPQFPGGVVGTARLRGYSRTLGPNPTFTPFLVDLVTETSRPIVVPARLKRLTFGREIEALRRQLIEDRAAQRKLVQPYAGDTGAQSLELEPGATAGSPGPAWRRRGGYVVLSGSITCSVAPGNSLVVCNLPEQAWPAEERHTPLVGQTSSWFGTVSMGTTGEVSLAVDAGAPTLTAFDFSSIPIYLAATA